MGIRVNLAGQNLLVTGVPSMTKIVPFRSLVKDFDMDVGVAETALALVGGNIPHVALVKNISTAGQQIRIGITGRVAFGAFASGFLLYPGEERELYFFANTTSGGYAVIADAAAAKLNLFILGTLI